MFALSIAGASVGPRAAAEQRPAALTGSLTLEGLSAIVLCHEDTEHKLLRMFSLSLCLEGRKMSFSLVCEHKRLIHEETASPQSSAGRRAGSRCWLAHSCGELCHEHFEAGRGRHSQAPWLYPAKHTEFPEACSPLEKPRLAPWPVETRRGCQSGPDAGLGLMLTLDPGWSGVCECSSNPSLRWR